MCKHPDHLSAADFFKEQRGPLCTSYISATLNNLLVYRTNWTVHKKWKYEDWFFYKFHFLRVMSTVLSFNVKINGYILRENGFIYIYILIQCWESDILFSDGAKFTFEKITSGPSLPWLCHFNYTHNNNTIKLRVICQLIYTNND